MTARQVALALAVSLALVTSRGRRPTRTRSTWRSRRSRMWTRALFSASILAIGFTFKKPGVDHEEERVTLESGDPATGTLVLHGRSGAHFYGDDDTADHDHGGRAPLSLEEAEKLPEATIQRTRAAGEPVHPETKVALFLQGTRRRSRIVPISRAGTPTPRLRPDWASNGCPPTGGGRVCGYRGTGSSH